MKTTCEEEGYCKARSREHPFLSQLPSPSSSQSHHMQLFNVSSTDVGIACSTGLQQDWVLRGSVQRPTKPPCLSPGTALLPSLFSCQVTLH